MKFLIIIIISIPRDFFPLSLPNEWTVTTVSAASQQLKHLIVQLHTVETACSRDNLQVV